MRLEKKLLILTLFLAFVVVIPGVALAAQDYPDLSGIWNWEAPETCNEFESGKTSVEREPIQFCIVHDTESGEVLFLNGDGWVGYTENYFIAADLIEYDEPTGENICNTSVLTGRVSRDGSLIQGTLVYFERYGCGFEDVCTASYHFTMTKVSDDPCP